MFPSKFVLRIFLAWLCNYFQKEDFSIFQTINKNFTYTVCLFEIRSISKNI